MMRRRRMKPQQSSEAVGWRRHARRDELIRLVLDFVRSARSLASVRDIALVGSLCTRKQFPKDADLLVSVRDGADLAPLAALSRRLQGKAQGLGHGADIFLTSENNQYLGRICPWKHCAPGIRVSCDALHCGRRPFLHDDTDTIYLKPEVVQAPPVRLWPTIRFGPGVPDDLRWLLLEPLTRSDDTPPSPPARVV